MKYLSIAIALALGLVACPVVDVKPSTGTTLGKVELSFLADGSSLKAQFATALPDTRITFNGAPTCVTAIDAIPNIRYMKCKYAFTNNGAAIPNLVLYAYNQNGQSIGGTAIKNMANFNFGALTNAQTAQRFLPTHGTDSSGATVTNEADLALFTTAQATNIDQTATPSVLVFNDTVLEYGFIARNASNTRAIAANGTGTVTVAYKILDSDITKTVGATPYSFTLNFVLTSEDTARVTRSSEETTASADARASGTDEVMLVGMDSDNSLTGTTVRRGNVKIGTAPTYLFDTTKLSLWVPNFRSDTVKRLDAPFATAAAANATFDVPTVDNVSGNQGLFAGSTPNSITFDPDGNMWVARPVQSSIVKINKAALGTSPLVIAQTISVGGGAVGIKYANGLIWVALDPFGGVTNRLRAYNPAGTLVAEFTNGLNFPANIAFDTTGNVWVSNANNNTVVMYAKSRFANNPDNAVPDRIISNTNTGTTGGQNSLRYPEGLAFDWQDNLWVANNIEGQVGTEAPTIVKYTPTQIAASGNPTPNAMLILETASGTSGQPGGLAIDPLDGGLWVNYQIASSVLAGQVRKYDIGGGTFTGISTPAALVTYSNVTTYPGNGGLAFGNRP
jgi:sugar lactone lactonase YvrE